MNISELNKLPSIKVDESAAAETTCQFMKANGIPFSKNKRDDGSGTDFTMDDTKTADETIKKLTSHDKISKNFDFNVDANVIKVNFK